MNELEAEPEADHFKSFCCELSRRFKVKDFLVLVFSPFKTEEM